jgi:6-phosphogluconolactonase/glucosamine-6-phosphate isomerase/deaminase
VARSAQVVARSTQVVVTTPASAAAAVADEIETLVARCAREGRTATLAIATGRTPLLLYEALAHRAREGAFAQADVAIFPLDERCGCSVSGQCA